MIQLNIATILGLLLLGLLTGAISSMVGIGGGIVIVPFLYFVFAMSQKMAAGTSLAMLLPPIGILAVMNYYKTGNVDLRVAAILCVSFVAGGYFGSKFALTIPDWWLKKGFAVFLILVAIKYLFFDKK